MAHAGVATGLPRVTGLTTAATIWLTAAVGAAAGAGIIPIAAVATAVYLVVAIGYTAVEDHFIEPGRSLDRGGEKER